MTASIQPLKLLLYWQVRLLFFTARVYWYNIGWSCLFLLDSFMWKARVTQRWWFKIIMEPSNMLLYLTKFGLSRVLPWVLWNLKFSSKTEYVTHIYTLFYKKWQISKFKKYHELFIIIMEKFDYLPAGNLF